MIKKSIIILSVMAGSYGLPYAQGALDAYSLSQPDLKGTARYMGMAGAFGALGGDLSAISQNPGGIGVYRSSDVGFTLDLDVQSSTSTSPQSKVGLNQTKFYLNNIGAVFTLQLPSEIVPNLNFGFTFNKGASFNRVYRGNFNNLGNSMSNYIAGVSNANELTVGDVETTLHYDPYNPGYNDYVSPWISILGYDSYLINPSMGPTGNTIWSGLWNNNSMTGQNTYGSGSYYMWEHGGTNDFNIVLGGNVKDVFYWGMNFDIININYRLNSIWSENLTNALVSYPDNQLTLNSANWDLDNVYSVSGTGFNYQLGFILKPVHEFRLGFAFHTPTWYNLSEQYGAIINYSYGGSPYNSVTANNGVPGYNNFSLRTPWKIIASAAGVISDKLILSFDYEWANYGTMKLGEPIYSGGWGGYYDDYWDFPWYFANQPENKGPVTLPKQNAGFVDPYDPYGYENADIANYYKTSNTFRVGLEFKPVSSFSIRAGYCHVTSPVTKEAMNNQEIIYTSGTQPSYRFDHDTNYITCGLGYRYSRFYVDLAYVYKNMKSEFHAYTTDLGAGALPSPQSKVSFSNNQVVLSAGVRF